MDWGGVTAMPPAIIMTGRRSFGARRIHIDLPYKFWVLEPSPQVCAAAVFEVAFQTARNRNRCVPRTVP
jgi:hypothetical protein